MSTSGSAGRSAGGSCSAATARAGPTTSRREPAGGRGRGRRRRPHRAPPACSGTLNLGAGVSLLRSNIPLLPPSTRRAYLGPYVSLGLEQYIGAQALTFELRLGLIGTGPTTLSAIVGFKWGV